MQKTWSSPDSNNESLELMLTHYLYHLKMNVTIIEMKKYQWDTTNITEYEGM